MNGHILPRKELVGLYRAIHGGQAWRFNDIEDFSQNLNPFGPPKDIIQIIASTIKEVGHYPDDQCRQLKDTISKIFNVSPDCITVGAGSLDIIRNVPNAFINKGDKVVINRPSFAEYEYQCKIAGANIVWNDLLVEDDFRINEDNLLKTAFGARLLYICNPNNPTGRIESKDKIAHIVSECDSQGIMVILDETLLGLVPEYANITLSDSIKKFSNLLVISSLTKSFAIPGIRIGFGLADPDIIKEIEKVRMAWNVGQIEQAIANVLIRDNMDYVYHAASLMAKESVIMNSNLNKIGFPAGPISDSFFYFSSLESIDMTCPYFINKMLNHKIMIRNCSSFGPYFKNYIRYCVKDRKRNRHFVEAVDSIING